MEALVVAESVVAVSEALGMKRLIIQSLLWSHPKLLKLWTGEKLKSKVF